MSPRRRGPAAGPGGRRRLAPRAAGRQRRLGKAVVHRPARDSPENAFAGPPGDERRAGGRRSARRAKEGEILSGFFSEAKAGVRAGCGMGRHRPRSPGPGQRARSAATSETTSEKEILRRWVCGSPAVTEDDRRASARHEREEISGPRGPNDVHDVAPRRSAASADLGAARVDGDGTDGLDARRRAMTGSNRAAISFIRRDLSGSGSVVDPRGRCSSPPTSTRPPRTARRAPFLGGRIRPTRTARRRRGIRP